MDMIITDESPVNISDKIKEIIQLKSVEKIDTLRPQVASLMFNSQFSEEE